MAAKDVDIAVVGGGFFGCALALFLRSVTDQIVVIEAESGPLERASRVNQARVHTGFHYPRSFVTALRSRLLQARFVRDFPDAIVSDFSMIYAIAARRSKVSAARFLRMFEGMQAPISAASARHRALFDSTLIEDAFVCQEFAFDWTVLRDQLTARMAASGIQTRYDTQVARLDRDTGRTVVHLADGSELAARYVFNVTYSNINNLLRDSGLEMVALKHEMAEIALVAPPAELDGFAITVMDGPFFSLMPYPSEHLHSLTHVRYTPHFGWTDAPAAAATPHVPSPPSHWRHMMLDARRYVPSMVDIQYKRSIFETKTVLQKNERDDGRPILLSTHGSEGNIYSILGAKIDNIYDLFEIIPTMGEEWSGANTQHLFS